MREQSRQARVIDSPYWTAPEVIKSGSYTPAMDIWSLGIISIEMVQGEPPYFGMRPQLARQLIVAEGTPALKNRDAFTSDRDLIEFLISCLVVNTLGRATASELSQVSVLFTLYMTTSV